MPKRFIDEGVCISETIAKLSWFEEVLFYRLITKCDDFGRFWGDAELLRCFLFPRKPSVTCKQIEAAVAKLTTVRLLDRYIADGKAIVQLCSWNKFQNPRAVKSRFPGPEEADEPNTYNMQASCNKSEQVATKCSRIPEYPNTRIPEYPIPESARTREAFDAVWEAYPKKTGKDAAMESFVALSEDEQKRLLSAIQQAKQSEVFSREHGRFIPQLSNFISRGDWKQYDKVIGFDLDNFFNAACLKGENT